MGTQKGPPPTLDGLRTDLSTAIGARTGNRTLISCLQDKRNLPLYDTGVEPTEVIETSKRLYEGHL
jgi:hypothetical protein